MKKGFTLIELLVVIVIIGILVAIALPNFIRIKDKAKEAEVKQNCHAIQLALERYAVDSPGSVYPMYVNGGDWTDQYVVWEEWLLLQDNLDITGISNPDRQAEWLPAGQDVGDTMIMEAYLPSYPANPFMKNKSDTILPRIWHNPSAAYGVDHGPLHRIVGGRESTKMWECFGNVRIINSQSFVGDFWVHHIYNNPPYDAESDPEKTPIDGWKDPSGNGDLTGNFSYFARGVKDSAFGLTGASDCVGYTLAGYGAARTPGQDVYNRNGNYHGRFRTEYCDLDCSGDVWPDIPCLCDSGNAPNINQNDGGSDTIPDGVVVTLDSGVDKASKRTNIQATEG